jgi:hypothetical protein
MPEGYDIGRVWLLMVESHCPVNHNGVLEEEETIAVYE